MSAEARKNGWRGFDGIGQREKGGYLYRCDGMPSPVGCGSEVIVPRRLTRVGMKATGWLVCYGMDDDNSDDKDVVLTFCPQCAVVVTGGSTPSARKRSAPTAPAVPDA